MKRIFFVTLMLALCTCRLSAQIYTPVGITGYNNDIVADTGTDAAAVTSTGVDLQLKILYSLNFANTNGLLAGIPDNGKIGTGSRTYQLGDYSLNNALYLSLNGFAVNSVQSGDITLNTPESFSTISLLVFSTEQTSKVEITLNFADGTTYNAGQFTIADWFNGANAVVSAIGRIARQPAPPYVVEELNTSNPRLYPLDITIPCDQQAKLLTSVSFNYISGGGNDSRAVILALSGMHYTPLAYTSSVTPAACGKANGSAQVTATGGTGLLSYEWNSNPVQLTPQATGLPAGNYTVTITDGNICRTVVLLEVLQQSSVRVRASARPATICAGSSTTLSAVPAGGKIVHYTWQPGNISDSLISISPADTTKYIITAEDAAGCIATDTIQVNVIPTPAIPVVSPLSICPDSTATLSVENPESAYTYNWYSFQSGGTIEGTGPSFTTPAVTETTTWYVEAISGACPGNRGAVTVTSYALTKAPVVTASDITATSAVFTWKPVPGATGYLVSIDGGSYITPDSATYYKVTGLNQEQVSIKVIALGPLPCMDSDPGLATAKLKPGEVFIPNAFTPNGDGKNDIFKPEGNIREINMKIFNQWGELLSEITTVGNGWNGMSKGKVQPMGVYTYAIKIILNNGTGITKKGAVNLLR